MKHLKMNQQHKSNSDKVTFQVLPELPEAAYKGSYDTLHQSYSV